MDMQFLLFDEESAVDLASQPKDRFEGWKDDESLPLVVSFSGGESSAMMARYLQVAYPDRPKLFIFANTGKEMPGTYEFVQKCSDHFGWNVVWVEAVIHPENGVGTTHKVVDFQTADRTGKPYRDMCAKYGIANKMFPHCTRELKMKPIHHYVKTVLGWKKYMTAIGIRGDEKKRLNYKRAKKESLFYILDILGISKPIVNTFWNAMPFRLQLKGYQGNCTFCWKKSRNKLLALCQEMPEESDWWMEQEDDFSEGQYFFYRQNESMRELQAAASQSAPIEIEDDAVIYDPQASEQWMYLLKL